MSEPKNTTLAVYDAVKTALDKGEISKRDLRESFAFLSDHQFGIALSRARAQLSFETGKTLGPIPGRPGWLRVDRVSKTVEKAYGRSLKVVREARRYHAALINVQKHEHLAEDDRARINIDEIRAGRSALMVEREFLSRRRS